MLFNILSWVVFGFLAGMFASFLIGDDKRDGGCIINIILGILGAVVGGYVFQFLGSESYNQFSLYGFFVAVVGACIILLLGKIVRS